MNKRDKLYEEAKVIIEKCDNFIGGDYISPKSLAAALGIHYNEGQYYINRLVKDKLICQNPNYLHIHIKVEKK